MTPIRNYENSCGGCGIPLTGPAMADAELLTLQPRQAKSKPTISTWLCRGCAVSTRDTLVFTLADIKAEAEG